MTLSKASTHFFLAVLSLCLMACASTVKTRVNTFSAPAASVGRGTLIVQPAQEELKRSLEFAWYREKVEAALRDLGYVPVADPDAAEFVALLNYGVEAAPSDRDSYVTGGWGFGRSRYYGYGTSVMVVDEVDRDEFLRHVSLVIERNNGNSERIYEVNGASQGRCGVMSAVFDEMLNAMLQGFPAANASIKTISVRGDTGC